MTGTLVMTIPDLLGLTMSGKLGVMSKGDSQVGEGPSGNDHQLARIALCSLAHLDKSCTCRSPAAAIVNCIIAMVVRGWCCATCKVGDACSAMCGPDGQAQSAKGVTKGSKTHILYASG